MKKIAYLLVLLGFLPVFSKGQFIPLDEKGYLDSLHQKLKQPIDDSSKARINYNLSDYWSSRDTVQSKAYLDKAKQLSGNDAFLNAIYFYYQAGLRFDQNIAESQQLYMKTEALLKPIRSTDAYYFRAKLWSNYSILEQYKDNKEAYLQGMLNKALPMAKLSERNDEIGLLYINIGLVFSNAKNYKKAEHYLTLGLTALKRGPYYSASTLAYGYLRNIKNLLLDNKEQRARSMLDSVFTIIAPYPNSDNFLDYYEYEGMYYRFVGDYKNSIRSLDKGIEVAEQLGAAYNKYTLQFQKYKAYSDQGDFKSAKNTLLLAMQYNGISIALNRLTCFYELANTYKQLGEYKPAFAWLEKYASLQDSLHKVNTLDKLNALEVKYQSSEKEKQILSLQAEKNATELQAQKRLYTNRLLIIICIFLALLILGAIYYYWRNSKQKELNHQQQLKDLEQKQQLKVTQAMLDGEERERVRVARDLHDGLGGMLAGVKLNLSGWANEHAEAPQDKDLGKVIDQLDNSVSELRRIARNMIPETLLKFGLDQALKDLVSFYMQENLTIDFQPFNIGTNITLSIQLNIYRIVQELLSNTVKHANATQVVLQCSQNEKNFLITFEDNGRGFDPNLLNSAKGIGLNNLRSRVEFMNGKIELITAPGEGTTVNIEIELDAK